MRTSRALLWTGSQFVAVTLIELAGLAALARLLTPREIGVAAAAYAGFRVVTVIANFGLHPTIVRAPVLDRAFRRRVLGLAVMFGSGAGALLVAGLLLVPSARIAAEFRAVLWAMAPALPLVAFSMTGGALLLREQRFPTLFRLRLAATVAAQGVAVALAAAGAGPLALAVGFTTGVWVFAIGATWASGRRFLIVPDWRPGRDLLRGAGMLFGLMVTGQATRAVPLLLLGPLAGFAALGQYARASDLVEKGAAVVQEVAMSVLVPKVFAAARAGAEPGRLYPPAAARLASVVWPAALVLSALAGPVVGVLLGDQWGASVAPLAVLALGLMPLPVAHLASSWSVARGREGALLARALLVLALAAGGVVALHGAGLAVVAAWMAGLAWLEFGLALTVLHRAGGPSPGAVLRQLAAPLAVAAAAAAPALLAAQVPGTGLGADVLRLGLGTAGAVAAWLAAMAALRQPLLREIAEAVRA